MKKFGILFSFAILSVFFFQPVFAYTTIDSSGKTLSATVAPTGLSTADLQTTTGTFIKGALTMVGTVFFGLMVYGGFTWMTARGEEDQIKKSKDTIVAASVGIAIIIGAYAITNAVTRITEGSTPTQENFCVQNSDCGGIKQCIDNQCR